MLLGRRATLTGLAALLFASGVVMLMIALYNDAGWRGSFLFIALGLLAATLICWIAAAKWGTEHE